MKTARCSAWEGIMVETQSTAAPSEDAECPDPIVIATHNWSSQIVLSRVAGGILQAMGYAVRYAETDSNAVYDLLQTGAVSVEMEVWEGVFGKLFAAAVEAGTVVDAGSHAAITREEWWYPAYVEAMCPGLPDWRALNRCSAKFATDATGGKGMFLAGPKNWPQHHLQRIDALGMDFKMIHASSTEALWRAIDEAKAERRPIVMQNWTPNFIEAVHPGAFVEFPPPPSSAEQGAAEANPDMAHAYGAPVNGYLKKAAWAGMPTKWPRAYRALQQISFTNAQISWMAKLVDVDRMTPDDAAAAWLTENQRTWMPWTH